MNYFEHPDPTRKPLCWKKVKRTEAYLLDVAQISAGGQVACGFSYDKNSYFLGWHCGYVLLDSLGGGHSRVSE